MLDEVGTEDGSAELDFGFYVVGDDFDSGVAGGRARGIISSLSASDSRERGLSRSGSRASYSLRNQVSSDSKSKTFFSSKPGAFKSALDKCCSSVLVEDLDGRPLDAWLLTEIDHWNFEKERMVILTENSFITVKYDFIKQTAKDVKRIALHNIRKLQIGDFTYPHRSLMQRRDCGGVRVHFGVENPPSVIQRWNPWSREIPFSTFMHHPLIYQKDVEQVVDRLVYNIDLMAEALKAAVESCLQRRREVKVKELTVEEAPILIESFAGFTSVVFNQSQVGFFKDRGQISF